MTGHIHQREHHINYFSLLMSLNCRGFKSPAWGTDNYTADSEVKKSLVMAQWQEWGHIEAHMQVTNRCNIVWNFVRSDAQQQDRHDETIQGALQQQMLDANC
jgi:hypothetical protein